MATVIQTNLCFARAHPNSLQCAGWNPDFDVNHIFNAGPEATKVRAADSNDDRNRIRSHLILVFDDNLSETWNIAGDKVAILMWQMAE